MIRAIVSLSVLAAAALAVPGAPALAAPQGSAAPAAPRANTQLSKEDRDFLDDAAMGGLLEVKLGQLVVKQGSNEEVKRFAQRMIDDHTKVNQHLADLAQKEGLTVPQELDHAHQATLDKLSQLSGSRLDAEYMATMVSDHQTDVKAFEHQAKNGKDPALRQLAGATLPTLREHLTLATQVHDRLQR